MIHDTCPSCGQTGLDCSRTSCGQIEGFMCRADCGEAVKDDGDRCPECAMAQAEYELEAV